MPKMQQMHAAIEQWLVARTRFHEHGSINLDTYCAADEWLLAAFAVDWSVDSMGEDKLKRHTVRTRKNK